jgi:hypothetical protein
MSRLARTPTVWLIVVIAALVGFSLAAGSAVSGQCADYPNGHRCTSWGYGLIAVSAASAVVAALITLTAVASRLRRRRFRRP